jgi:hypothetical protein
MAARAIAIGKVKSVKRATFGGKPELEGRIVNTSGLFASCSIRYDEQSILQMTSVL